MSIPVPSKETLKFLAALALGCALLFAWNTITGWREGALQNEARGQTMQSASGTTADGQASDEARRGADAGIAAGRAEFEDTANEDAANEPTTSSRDTGAVPASRLRAFEQRRLARERLADDRLGRAGTERPERSGAEDPAER